MQPQVSRQHYWKSKYRDLERFISFFYQIDLTLNVTPAGKVLEIGVGNGIVSDYFRKAGLAVTTCDIDSALGPDVVGDVRQLPFPNQSFDAVVAFEVLEHIPFEDFERALGELARVSRRFVLISLPYRATGIEFALKFPFIRTIFGRSVLDFFMRIPLTFRREKPNSQHHWELDRGHFSLTKIRKILTRPFVIRREVRPVLDYYHYFFVLERR